MLKYGLILSLVLSLLGIYFSGPFAQDQEYHAFADQRSWLGIPNFLDVITNSLFILIGIAGLLFLIKHRQHRATMSWPVFFIGVLTVGFTSGFYHWHPTDDTLVWDRLSLAVMFMSLTAAVLAEMLDTRFDKLLLLPLLVLGIGSVLYWHFSGDLRLYIWAQLTPMILIPLLLIFSKSRYTHAGYLWMTFIFYLAAKVTEIFDTEIYELSGSIISGHSIKHIFAAIGLAFIVHMLRKRRRQTD